MKQLTLEQVNSMADDNTLLGMIHDIPNEIYHKSKGFSSSNIIYISKYSLAQFLVAWKRPVLPSNEMNLGTATHTAILEPEKFKETVVYLPPDCRGNSGSALKGRDLFYRANTNKTVVESKEKYDSIKNMADSVNDFLAGSEVPDLISKGDSEVSCYALDEEYGMLLKCRPDKLHKSLGVSVNLKTAHSVLEYDFQKAIMDYSYHWSTAMYSDVLASILKMPITELHLIVETEYPHRVSLRHLDEGAIDKGRKDYRNILAQIAEAKRTNVWRAIQGITLPHYAWYK